MRVYWSGEFQSSTGKLRKDGTRLAYKVSLFDDGSASCACADYILRGINVGKLNYRCKHIRQAAEENPEWQAAMLTGITPSAESATPPVPSPPTSVRDRPAVDGLTLDDIERRTRRRL